MNEEEIKAKLDRIQDEMADLCKDIAKFEGGVGIQFVMLVSTMQDKAHVDTDYKVIHPDEMEMVAHTLEDMAAHIRDVAKPKGDGSLPVNASEVVDKMLKEVNERKKDEEKKPENPSDNPPGGGEIPKGK